MFVSEPIFFLISCCFEVQRWKIQQRDSYEPISKIEWDFWGDFLACDSFPLDSHSSAPSLWLVGGQTCCTTWHPWSLTCSEKSYPSQMESSLSRIIFEGRTFRFQGCSPSWFEAHWQLSIKILHLNFHFPNAQFYLLRVYLEWGGNAVGQNFPQTTLEHMEIANPRYVQRSSMIHSHTLRTNDLNFENTPLVNPNPPKNNHLKTHVVFPAAGGYVFHL